MAHDFLSLDMKKIPAETKANVLNFWKGLFSNDGEYDESGKMTKEPSRMLFDGYNDKGELVHPQKSIDAWLQWSVNAVELQDSLFGTATRHTKEEFKALRVDVNSIWYVDPAGLA